MYVGPKNTHLSRRRDSKRRFAYGGNGRRRREDTRTTIISNHLETKSAPELILQANTIFAPENNQATNVCVEPGSDFEWELNENQDSFHEVPLLERNKFGNLNFTITNGIDTKEVNLAVPRKPPRPFGGIDLNNMNGHVPRRSYSRASTASGISSVRSSAVVNTYRRRPIYVTFGFLNAAFLLAATSIAMLVIKDLQNAEVRVDATRRAEVPDEYIELNNYPTSGTIMILGSAVLDLIGLSTFMCGCIFKCSFYRHYMRLILLNFILCITASIVIMLTDYKAKTYLEILFNVLMKAQYGYNNHDKLSQEFIDTIQNQGHCCGFKNYTDWLETAYTERSGSKNILPKSCCEQVDIKSGQPYTLCMVKHVSVAMRGDVTGVKDESRLHLRGCELLIFQMKGTARQVCKIIGFIKCALLLAAIFLNAILNKIHTENSPVSDIDRRRNRPNDLDYHPTYNNQSLPSPIHL